MYKIQTLNKIAKIGLDVPQITKLVSVLRAQGIDIDSSIYTVDAAYEFLKNKIKVSGKK